MVLPVNIDTTYGDSVADSTVKLHQQHHDEIHTLLNAAPLGKVGYASTSTAQSTITTLVDLTGLTVTWTAVPGRLYQVSYGVSLSGNTANELIGLYVADSSNVTHWRDLFTSGALFSGVWYGQFSGFMTTTGSGSITRKLRLERNVGVGTLGTAPNPSWPCFILVEDVGLA